MNKISLTFLATLTVIAANCYAEPNKVLYELQERCSKRTAEVFKTDEEGVQNTKEGQSITGYENHFSALLNRCFARQSIMNINHKSSKSPSSHAYVIYEVNEGKQMASMMKLLDIKDPTYGKVIVCFVNGKKCSSEAAFDELTKPYMEQ